MDGCQPGLRQDVYRFVVNGCAPAIISGHDLVSIWLTEREADERRAFGRGGETCYNLLKKRHILSLTNWPLN
jgi:hypothetical protein